LATRFDALIAGVDFSGSGQAGVLIGGDLRLSSGRTAPDQRPLAARIRAMASQGDGSFRDASGDVIVARPDAFLNPATPIELIADFNGDGRPDIVIVDYGVECVFDPTPRRARLCRLPAHPAAEWAGRALFRPFCRWTSMATGGPTWSSPTAGTDRTRSSPTLPTMAGIPRS
jgi:hypothetical protein